MNKKFNKLSDLIIADSFIQLNTIKGFKYIDKAGEIVNEYFRKVTAPQYAMGLDGLIIENPIDKVNSLRVTPDAIWLKFNNVKNLTEILDIFITETSKLLKILDVSKVKRVGWRTYFVYEFNSAEESRKYFKKLINFSADKLVFIRVNIKTHQKDIDCVLTIKEVENIEEKKCAVLFDVDVFRNDEINDHNIKRVLKAICEFKDNEKYLLTIINNTFIE